MKIVLDFKIERTESSPLRYKDREPLCTASVMDVFSMSSSGYDLSIGLKLCNLKPCVVRTLRENQPTRIVQLITHTAWYSVS